MKIDALKFELGAIDRQLKDNLQQRVKLDAGAGPLGLISGLISETQEQIKLESDAKQAKALDGSIAELRHKYLVF